MVGGMDKYFTDRAVCYRDEDARGDRSWSSPAGRRDEFRQAVDDVLLLMERLFGQGVQGSVPLRPSGTFSGGSNGTIR
jgi:hypothetical protein